jgi:hypothetical protein
MKRLFLICFTLVLLAGCKKVEPYGEDFTYTGCQRETKADSDSIWGDLSLLTLKYEDGALRVTRENAVLNCSFQSRGLVCEVSVKGDGIYYKVDYEKEGEEVKCVCRVETMNSLVKGLEEGKRYTFYYRCFQNYTPFSFTFKEGLKWVQDISAITPNE